MEETYLEDLRALVDMQTRLGDAGVAAADLRAIFRNADELLRRQTALTAKVVQACTSSDADADACATVCRVVSDSFAHYSLVYVPYVQRSSYCAEALQRYERSSRVQGELKAFCARAVAAPQRAVSTFADALTEPYRHLFRLKGALETVQDCTPPDTVQWTQLQRTVERCGGVIAQLDEATLQSEQVKALFFLRPIFPDDWPRIVTYCREYLFDGVLTVLAFHPADSSTTSTAGAAAVVDAPSESTSLSLSSSSSSSSSSTTSAAATGTGNEASGTEATTKAASEAATTETAVVEGPYRVHQTYHVFLFDDMVMFCACKKKGSAKHPLRMGACEPVQTLAAAHNACLQRGARFTLQCASGELELEAKNAAAMGEWLRVVARAAAHRQRTVVLGAPLEAVLARPSERHGAVPAAVERALACVEKYGLEREGIFRVATAKAEADKVRAMVDSGRLPHFLDPVGASVLVKQWLAALPVPLLHLRARPDAAWLDAPDDPAALRACVAALDRVASAALLRVAEVLRAVAAHSAANRMPAANLAIVFGVLLVPGAAADPHAAARASTVVQTLLTHFDTVFQDVRARELTRKTSLTSTRHCAAVARTERLRSLASSRYIATAPRAPAPEPLPSQPSFSSHPIPRNTP